MKKILVVFSGPKFLFHVLEQAVSLAKQDGSLLVGVFLRPPTPSEIIYPFINEASLVSNAFYLEEAGSDDVALIKAQVALFSEACHANKVRFATHSEGGTPVHELLKESVFADLIVIDAKADLYGATPSLLTTSLREFLADSHCPVLVVHEKAQPVENTILTYDGSASSMHAIKMYSYLFASLLHKPAYLVCVDEGHHSDLPNAAKINSWLGQHFTNLQTDVLTGDTKNVLSAYINKHEHNSIVVMGAYGRSAVSRMFRQSLANYIISQTTIPLFITHG